MGQVIERHVERNNCDTMHPLEGDRRNILQLMRSCEERVVGVASNVALWLRTEASDFKKYCREVVTEY